MPARKPLVAALLVLGFVLVLGLGADVGLRPAQSGGQPPLSVERREIARATFVCDGGKTIDATFYASGPAAPAAPAVRAPPRAPQSPPPTRASPTPPPAPNGGVHLALSDGRKLDLAQTLSADGARYADTDESTIFWNKGRGAVVLEHDLQTYRGCIAVAPDPGGLPQVYESGAEGFSIRYPANYTVDPDYRYEALGPGREIGGVKFTIPASAARGTNLGTDTYVAVEQIPRARNCTADRFLPREAGEPATVADGGTTYSRARSIGAGAGNRYDETVYALPGTNPCIAVRYFVHYGVLQNYPPGAVRGFDERRLLERLDAIRRTLLVQQ